MMQQEITPAGQLVTILAIYRAECADRLGKLAKRAAKYGQTISWTETPRTDEQHFVRPDGRKVTRTVEVVDLIIQGSAPRCGDYTLEASLERTPAGVLISSAPGTKVGKLGRDWNGRCDHCGSNRARFHGYVVRDARGRRKVVGKSCLRDHLGMDAPAGLAAMFKNLRDLEAAGDDEGGWGFGGRWAELTEGVIATTRAAIALWGWRPGSFEGKSTSSYVNLIYGPVQYDRRDGEINKEERAALRAELKTNAARYEAEAQAVMEWGRTMKPRTDYLHNLAVALANETVDGRRFNLVVSAAAAYDKQKAVEAERKAEAEARPVSEWVGTVGQRIVGEATLLRTITLPDYGWGAQLLFTFVDAKGAVISWKTGSHPRVDGHPMEQGRAYQLTMTVKGHAEYKGTKETRVSRVKVAAAK